MTVSIAKMSIDYYLEHAVTGDGQTRDLTSYYTEAKAPPGTWWGSGLAGLTGLTAGQEVTEDAARSLYDDQEDPDSGRSLGRPRPKTAPAPEGARTPAGQPAKPTREGVAGFDLTFSPPKSVSALWALAGPELQGRLHAAHRQATEETLRWVEVNVAQSRAGHGGVAHVPVTGLIGSLFDHWDSRAGDPQLHTHAVLSNRVQRDSDGQWVTLDSYTLHRHVVAISETYNSLLFDRLAETVGAQAESRDGADIDVAALIEGQTTDGPAQPGHRVELAGVPDRLIEEFSTRAAQIRQRTDQLVAAYEADTGRRPTNREILAMRQQATLENRPDKADLDDVTLPEKMNTWRQRALHAGADPEQIIAEATGRDITTVRAGVFDADARAAIGAWAIADASQRRTTFTRANVRASAERVLRLVRCTSADERLGLVDDVVDRGLDQAVDLTGHRSTVPDVTAAATSLRGASVFDHHAHAAVYTTQAVMDDEAQLIAAASNGAAPALSGQATGHLSAWRSPGGHSLGHDQLAAATAAVTDRSGITAIIGPAGTGKTTTMSAITAAWHAERGPSSVIGLAPSAVAAGVLGDEIGVDTDNVAKWLYESVGEGAARRVERVEDNEAALAALDALPHLDAVQAGRAEALRARLAADYAEQAAFAFQPGQLVIVDEASMVATHQLAEISRQAQAAGAKLLLVGDPAQLEAVDAGGFLGHMERNMDHAALSEVWRFTHSWEAEASLALRSGQASVAATYAEAGRIHGRPDEEAADNAYDAWQADTAAGRASLLIASDNETVVALNARAHADRVAAGTVDVETTARLRDGAEAGAGDVILARRNDRRLRDSAGVFVANGTRLAITAINDDGSIAARVESSGAAITLDADYAATSAELGYATTAHRSQGVTVDTAHAVAGPGMSRELLYVAMTRGRQANHAYIDFDDDADVIFQSQHDGPGVQMVSGTPSADDPAAVFAGIVERAQAERSAHEVKADELGWANDLGRLCHESAYLSWAARTERTQAWLAEHFDEPTQAQLRASPDWPRMVNADPARAFAGDEIPADAAAIAAACDRSHMTEGPADMLPAVTPATADQAQLHEQVSADIADQLAARRAVIERDQPAWYTQLAQEYPNEADRRRAVDATLVWRAVSDRTELDTAHGSPPPATDSLRPYWNRLQAALAVDEPAPDVRPPSAPDVAGPEPEEIFAGIDFDDDGLSQHFQGLEEPPPDVDAPAPPDTWDAHPDTWDAHPAGSPAGPDVER